MSFYLLLLLFDTLMVLFLTYALCRLDKKCWDLLSVLKGMSEHIADLEEKIGGI